MAAVKDMVESVVQCLPLSKMFPPSSAPVMHINILQIFVLWHTSR